MRYVPPLGESGDAPYIDFNPRLGLAGSVLPGKAVEHTQREVVNAIKMLGLVPDENKVDQLAQGLNAKIGGTAHKHALADVDGLQTALDSKAPKNHDHGENGLTAAQVEALIRAALPRGFIGLWSGTVTNVPSGWALCNGLNNTPDLRDRFVVGAGLSYQAGAKGGSIDHGHPISGSVGETTLTVSQIPAHNHGVTAGSPAQNGQESKNWTTVLAPTGSQTTSATGGGKPHTHSLTSAAAGKASSLPPYYALAYIMKL